MKEYTKNWITRFRAGTELEASESERMQLNTAIATIAADGCKIYQEGINHKMQKAAKKMMNIARNTSTEPLYHLKKVCDGWDGLDVYPASFLIAAKYIATEEEETGQEPRTPSFLH